MATITMPTAADNLSAALRALDALLVAGDAVAELWSVGVPIPNHAPDGAGRAQRAASALESAYAAAYAARQRAAAAMAAIAPDAEECAFCGTRYGVAYVQRGDLYLCEHCRPWQAC